MTLDHLREIALIQISQAQRTNAMNAKAIAAEITKLNKAQRKSLRQVVPGQLSALKVEQIGWVTRVYCESNGFRYNAKLGPRGRKLSAIIPIDIH